MRHARTTTILLTFLLALGAPAATAWADAGEGDTSAPAVTETAATTETKPPVDTHADSKPSTDTSTPDTEVPTTTEPTCEDTSSCEVSTTTPETPEVPVTPEVPTTTPETPDAKPETPDAVPDTPTTTGSGDLPFTGPGDVVLALVLAMLAGSGGILFMAGASGREQIEGLSSRTMDSPSGFHVAYRDLRKSQLSDDD